MTRFECLQGKQSMARPENVGILAMDMYVPSRVSGSGGRRVQYGVDCGSTLTRQSSRYTMA